MLTYIKKYKLALALIIFLLAAGGVYGVVSKEPTLEVEEKYAKVSKGNVSVALEIDGKSVIDRRDLSFEIAGLVRGLNVEEGDEVKAWQTLAYLDTRDTRKNLENTMRDYLSQRNDFEEMGQVTNPGVPLNDTIKRILEKNQWDLEKSVLDVELKDLAIRKSYLSAPIAGTIVDLNLLPGELSTTSKVALTIVDLNTIVFESYVEDIEALKIKEDMTVRIVFDALPDNSVDGKVSFVSPIATIDENDLSTYKILIEFEELEFDLLDGMTGEAEVISKEVNGVLKIPNTTVKREDGQSIVYLQTDEGNHRQVIELGFTNGKEVEVKSGLEIGQTLIDWK